MRLLRDNLLYRNQGLLKEKLCNHWGHQIEIAVYGDGESYALECLDCNEVILDTDCYELVGLDE